MALRDRIRGLFRLVSKDERHESKLLEVLRTWQIFFIAMTAVVGTGAFTDFARASATVGPAGLLVAIVMVGIIAAAFMEALSEMLQILRTINPLVEYVHAFVDPALAKCVAGVYWFSYASFMAVQLVTAASYLRDDMSIGLTVTIFFIIIPVAIILLNLQRVYYYAWMETVFGALKLLLVLSITMNLIYIAGNENGAGNITQGFHSGKAICIVLEYVSFSFLGIEAIAVMSFEAKGTSALKNSSQIIAWVTLVLYLLFAVALNMCFNWNDPNLSIAPYGNTDKSKETQSAVLLAAAKLAYAPNLTRALKGILVFCAISAANTTLYISSRMLYGTAFNSIYRNFLKIFRSVTKKGVPKGAIIFSGLFFCLWVPFVSVSTTVTAANVVDFFGFAGSIGVLFVWGTTCLAYLRYHYWLSKYKSALNDSHRLRRYNRWNRQHSMFFTPTAYFNLQPWTTWFGFIGCVFFVFACPSAVWWGRSPTPGEFFQSYTLHLVVAGCWLAMKFTEFYNKPADRKSVWRPWVTIDDNGPDALQEVLDSFQYFVIEGHGEGYELREFLPPQPSSGRQTSSQIVPR